MRLALFYHSIISDWNNGNAHFLRGVVAELTSRGHEVRIFQPQKGWSLQNLTDQYGPRPVRDFHRLFPGTRSVLYAPDFPALERMLDGTDAVIVHEWNDPGLVRRIGRLRRRGASFRLLFHDTHHRFFSSPRQIDACGLQHFDGILAFGDILRRYYLRQGVGPAWTWHEAADTRVFRPRLTPERRRDLVWIGNGGDGERRQEYETFLFEPIRNLGLRATVYGVRYEPEDLRAMAAAGLSYRGWLANYHVPEVFAAHRLTLHIPRQPYTRTLKGIPTIRPFEALACGIPLICAPWEDTENLFTPGKDYLVAPDARAMTSHIRDVLGDAALAAALSAHGRLTVLSRHTCVHRVDELMAILKSMGLDEDRQAPAATGLNAVRS